MEARLRCSLFHNHPRFPSSWERLMEILARVAKEECQQLRQVPRGALPTPAEPINADQRAKNDSRTNLRSSSVRQFRLGISEIRVRRGFDCASFSPPVVSHGCGKRSYLLRNGGAAFPAAAATRSTFSTLFRLNCTRWGQRNPAHLKNRAGILCYAPVGISGLRRVANPIAGSFQLTG